MSTRVQFSSVSMRYEVSANSISSSSVSQRSQASSVAVRGVVDGFDRGGRCARRCDGDQFIAAKADARCATPKAVQQSQTKSLAGLFKSVAATLTVSARKAECAPPPVSCEPQGVKSWATSSAAVSASVSAKLHQVSSPGESRSDGSNSDASAGINTSVSRDTCPETKAADTCPETKAADTCPETKAADPCPETKAADRCAEAKSADTCQDTSAAADACPGTSAAADACSGTSAAADSCSGASAAGDASSGDSAAGDAGNGGSPGSAGDAGGASGADGCGGSGGSSGGDSGGGGGGSGGGDSGGGGSN